MPISSFSEGLRIVLSFLPGTYGTSLLRNHALKGVFEEMAEQGLPTEAITALKEVADCNLYFFDTKVETWAMYLMVVGAIVLLVAGFALLMALSERKNRK